MPFGRRSFLLRPFLMAPSPGVREGSHPLALSHGVARRGRVRHTLPRASSGFRLLRFFPASPGGREGSHPLALSRGVAGRSQVRHTPRARPQNFDRSVSLSQPGCERVHTLSRSPVGSQVAAKCAIRCRARPRNFDCSVSFPRCRRCERVHTLSRSPMGS